MILKRRSGERECVRIESKSGETGWIKISTSESKIVCKNSLYIETTWQPRDVCGWRWLGHRLRCLEQDEKNFVLVQLLSSPPSVLILRSHDYSSLNPIFRSLSSHVLGNRFLRWFPKADVHPFLRSLSFPFLG